MAADVQEKWIKWVALTTTILAVGAAIGSLKGGGYSTQVQLMTTRENNKWSYFQSKSIKQLVVEIERDLLGIELAKADNPAVKDMVAQKIKTADENIQRYNKEKNEIKAEAEGLSTQQGELKRHGGNFGIAVMFFQIATCFQPSGHC
jgi:hypothetical protein